MAANFLLVRLRKEDLPPLTISHPYYREIRVYSAAPRPEAVIAEIRTWLTELEPQEG